MVNFHYTYQKNGFDKIQAEQNTLFRDNPRWLYINSGVYVVAGTTMGIPPIVAWVVYDDGARE